MHQSDICGKYCTSILRDFSIVIVIYLLGLVLGMVKLPGIISIGAR